MECQKTISPSDQHNASMCGGDLTERVTNKYVPKKHIIYPNGITSLWKFSRAYQCVLLEQYLYAMEHNSTNLYIKIRIRMQFHYYKL